MRHLIFVALFVLWGCSQQGTVPTTTMRDSAGVQIVENPAQAPAVNWVIGTEPAVVIGDPGLGERYELYGVRSAVRLSDGRIAIGNGGTHELRFYSQSGEFLSSVGGEGEGPGEFSNMGWMQRLAGDSLFVYDYNLRRIAVFSGDGEFVRGVRLESTPDLPFASPIGVFGDRSLLARGFADTRGEPIDGLQRYESPLFHLDETGLLISELGMYPGNEVYYRAFEGGFSFHDAVFPKDTRFWVHKNAMYLAANDSFEVRILSPDGETSKIVRRAHTPVRGTSEHFRLELERRLAAAGSDEHASIEEVFDEMPKPEFFPAYLHLRVDDGGSMWVQEYPVPEAQSAIWCVFDSTGALVGEVDAPLGFEPYHIGDGFLLGKWQDELGVEYVQLYELIRN